MMEPWKTIDTDGKLTPLNSSEGFTVWLVWTVGPYKSEKWSVVFFSGTASRGCEVFWLIGIQQPTSHTHTFTGTFILIWNELKRKAHRTILQTSSKGHSQFILIFIGFITNMEWHQGCIYNTWFTIQISVLRADPVQMCIAVVVAELCSKRKPQI